MNRELLERPFSPEQIKQRQGAFGQTLDYVEGHAVIARLNEAFDGQWSFEVISHEVMESEVVVLGKLTAEGIIKTQFGSSSITRAKETGEIISLCADLKSSATDALKKCATMLGIGLHLYADSRKRPSQNNRNGEPIYCSSFPNNGGRNGSNGGNGNNSRLSQKQHSFLLKLADEKGVSRNQLNEMSRERFGSVVSFLSRGDASSFIGELTAN